MAISDDVGCLLLENIKVRIGVKERGAIFLLSFQLFFSMTPTVAYFRYCTAGKLFIASFLNL